MYAVINKYENVGTCRNMRNQLTIGAEYAFVAPSALIEDDMND